jgi:hypothetical protein
MSCQVCNSTSGIYNIVADQGATFQGTITWKDSARTPYDITGYTARMHVRTETDSGDIVLGLTTENGRIVIYGTQGRIDLNIPRTVMEAVAPDKYVYDLEIVAPITGIVTRLTQGNFVVRPEVTR